MNFLSIIAIILVFVGCSVNVVFLELLVRDDPGSGNIITFAQFFIITIEGLFFTNFFFTKKPTVPLQHYLAIVVMFFITSIAANYALNFNISMPLQMIFKAGSLMANMVLGIFILKKRYTISKYVSVILISAGITLCTYASAKTFTSKATTANEENWNLIYWLMGVGMLTVSLFLSAQMGIYQEMLAKKFGKHPRESLFYAHALPLPMFILIGKDIYNHAQIFSNSEPIELPFIGTFPKLWLYLIGNVITQYICIRSVYILTTELSSLTVTLILTLRKFMSIVFSILYFKNPFTVTHWLGTGLVFVGTFIFIDIFNIVRHLVSPPKQIKTD